MNALIWISGVAFCAFIACLHFGRRVDLAYCRGYQDGRKAGRAAAVHELKVELDLLEWKAQMILPAVGMHGSMCSTLCGGMCDCELSKVGGAV